MKEIINIFKALSDETRMKILIIISKRCICAKGIAEHLQISEAAVSQHLKILRDAEIIFGEKRGYYVHYTVQKKNLSKVINIIEEINGESILSKYTYKVDIPFVCKVQCKGSNRCCNKKYEA